MGQVPETKAKYYGSLAMGTRCNNCPSRGCSMCPMFGVGQNPVYQKRVAAREEKKARSGAAAAARREEENQRKMDTIYGSAGLDGEEGGASPFDDEAFDAIFGGGYAAPSEEYESAAAGARSSGGRRKQPSAAMVPGDAESQAKERFREVLEDDDATMEGLDPYAVLGVKKRASAKEIKRAFRRLALRWHPDRCAGLPTRHLPHMAPS